MAASSAPKTVHELYEATRTMSDVTTALVIQDAITPLLNSGEVKQDSPLTADVIHKIRSGLELALNSDGAASIFTIMNTIAETSAQIGSLGPAKTASAYLESIVVSEQVEMLQQLSAGNMASDSLDLIPTAMRNLRIEREEKLTHKMLKRVQDEVGNLLKHYFLKDDDWNDRGYTSYKIGLYEYFNIIEARLNQQLVENLESALSIEPDRKAKVTLSQNTLALVYRELKTHEWNRAHTRDYPMGRGREIGPRIRAKIDSLRKIITRAELDFEEISDSIE